MSLERGIIDFLSFLRRPSFDYKRDEPESFKILLILYSFIFLIVFLVALPLISLTGITEMDHAMTSAFDELPKWAFFLMVVVFAPVIEEYIFRFHLRYPVLGFILFYIGVCSFFGYVLYKENVSNLVLGGTALLMFAAFVWVMGHKSEIENIRYYFKKYFGTVFYGTMLLFAFIHITNYTKVDSLLFVPILVLPQAILALFLGYVRVRNSISISIFFHALHNSIPTLLFLLIPMPPQ